MIAVDKKKKRSWLLIPNFGDLQSDLFVPATPDSILAKMIRDCDKRISKGRSVKIRIVERSGRSVKNHLAPNYPWPPHTCSDQDCFPCSTSTSIKISCRKPGVG